MSVRLAELVGSALERRADRRGFLVRATLVASALAAVPADFILRPGTAYAAICRCGNPACGCGSPCCDGYTEFCCTLTGSNTCPPGTFAGGWWKADGSRFCGGPRYYIDCHGECGCGCAPGQPFCTCDGLQCGCGKGQCANRVAGCVTFRYGQCHQEVACAGRIACRVVTCTPAYLLDNACTTSAMTDEFTAQHDAPCLHAPARVTRAYALAAAPDAGVWLAGADGGVFTYGGAPFYGSMGGHRLDAPVVGMTATPDGAGYWLVATDGGIFAFGSARFYGSMGGRPLNAPVVGMTATPDGAGYWLVASDGGIFSFGSAQFYGSTGGLTLLAPIVAITAAPDGRGYWMVASDGGVFAFGSARFFGSAGGQDLHALIAGMVPTPSGGGYWLWGQDGAVMAFGDAPNYGSYRTRPGNLALPAGGVDSFYGLRLQRAPSGGTAITGYTLWSVSPLSPPPQVQASSFP